MPFCTLLKQKKTCFQVFFRKINLKSITAGREQAYRVQVCRVRVYRVRVYRVQAYRVQVSAEQAFSVRAFSVPVSAEQAFSAQACDAEAAKVCGPEAGADRVCGDDDVSHNRLQKAIQTRQRERVSTD